MRFGRACGRRRQTASRASGRAGGNRGWGSHPGEARAALAPVCKPLSGRRLGCLDIPLPDRNRNRFPAPRPRACGAAGAVRRPGSAAESGRADMRDPGTGEYSDGGAGTRPERHAWRGGKGLSGRLRMPTAKPATDQCGPAPFAPYGRDRDHYPEGPRRRLAARRSLAPPAPSVVSPAPTWSGIAVNARRQERATLCPGLQTKMRGLPQKTADLGSETALPVRRVADLPPQICRAPGRLPHRT
jgi:hypothetical protein